MFYKVSYNEKMNRGGNNFYNNDGKYVKCCNHSVESIDDLGWEFENPKFTGFLINNQSAVY